MLINLRTIKDTIEFSPYKHIKREFKGDTQIDYLNFENIFIKITSIEEVLKEVEIDNFIYKSILLWGIELNGKTKGVDLDKVMIDEASGDDIALFKDVFTQEVTMDNDMSRTVKVNIENIESRTTATYKLRPNGFLDEYYDSVGDYYYYKVRHNFLNKKPMELLSDFIEEGRKEMRHVEPMESPTKIDKQGALDKLKQYWNIKFNETN
jgi:hypothetical protein